MIHKILKSILLIVNICCVIWLMLTLFAGKYDSSDSPSIISLICFGLPFALLANIIFPFIWLFAKGKKKIFFLLSALPLIFFYADLLSVYGIHLGGKSSERSIQNSEKRLKIMTYNVHLFDLGGWTKDPATQRKLLDFIKTESPDILCLQEFYMDQKDNKEPMTEHLANLGYPYMEFTKTFNYKKSRLTSNASANEMLEVGIAVFSKYPLKNKVNLSFPNSNNYKALFTDVQVSENATIKLLVTHLQSFRLDNEDRQLIDHLKENTDVASLKQNETKNILKKMMIASQYRARQANFLRDFLKSYRKYPIILCGDFNDVPGSYVYNTLKEDLDDPFQSKGFGLGRTFASISPTLRIDHILYNQEFLQPLTYNIFHQNYSDHYPVEVEFVLKK